MVLDNIKAGLNTSVNIEICHWNISCASSLSFGRFPSLSEESSMTELRPLVVRNFANLEVDSIHSSSFCSFAILSSIWLISLSPLCTTSVSYSFTESNSISLSSFIWQIRCSILQGLVADTCQWCWTLQESLYVCSLATVYPNLSVRTDFGYLWITKVGSVQNTAAVQTFAQSRNLLRRLAEYKPGPHVFPHWSPSRYMKVSLPRTSHERSLYLRQFRHGFLVMSFSDCWLNCLEYWWYEKRLSLSYFTKVTPL